MLAGATIWLGYAAILQSSAEGILLEQIGELFQNIGATGLLLLTGIVGGLIAALGGLSGAFGRLLFVSPDKSD